MRKINRLPLHCFGVTMSSTNLSTNLKDGTLDLLFICLLDNVLVQNVKCVSNCGIVLLSFKFLSSNP